MLPLVAQHAGDAWQLKDGDGQVVTVIKPRHFQQPTTLPQREREAISLWMSKRGFVLLGTQAAYLLKTVWVAIDDQQGGSSEHLPPFTSIGQKRGTVGCKLRVLPHVLSHVLFRRLLPYHG